MEKAEETQIRRWFENGRAGWVVQLVKCKDLSSIPRTLVFFFKAMYGNIHS